MVLNLMDLSLERPSHSATPPPDPGFLPAPAPKPPEPFIHDDFYLEKPAFILPKPIPHAPKISPSSIPNPSPSVTATMQGEPGYPSYGGYLYSTPGYSAFQPVPQQGLTPLQQNQQTPQTQTDFSFAVSKETCGEKSDEKVDESPKEPLTTGVPAPQQQDFEEHFTPEIVPAASTSISKQPSEANMSITSLAQGSGATVTMPSQESTKDTTKKTPERFSLKTSIPISKIDMKCVNNTADAMLQNPVSKQMQAPFNPVFQNSDVRVEIQSNIVIKSASVQKEIELAPEIPKPINSTHTSNNISALLTAAEAINKTDQFWQTDTITDGPSEIHDPPTFSPQIPVSAPKPVFNPVNTDNNKLNFSNKPPEGSIGEQLNQILFIQNKNSSSPKMLLTIQQQSPQACIQRPGFESKNLQAPSRLSGQIKKCKEEHINENGTSSKVVALKRLHQENSDENDFENLITENQIYGNKIVVKEKSGALQEQDLKKSKDKSTQETKNVVLQPNFLYLSNVQFPANLMMIKNNKISQPCDAKVKTTVNENKSNEPSTANSGNDTANTKTLITQNATVSKDLHVLKSSNNVLQTIANKTSKPDIVLQTSNQKVIVNSQIVYQVPMIVDADNNKVNQPSINGDYPKVVGQNTNEFSKPLDQSKTNDKLFVACPYQTDSKLQPKIVITNIRPKITKVKEVSTLDIYEKRKRMRRLKYLSTRDTKETPKPDVKKPCEKADNLKNIITPENMKAEIYKEFKNTKVRIEESSDSDSDYEEEELEQYNSIIEEYRNKSPVVEKEKIEFLSSFRLATRDTYKEKELDRQERSLSKDAVASAYITAGRLDRLSKHEDSVLKESDEPAPVVERFEGFLEEPSTQKKQMFLSHLRLALVTPNYKRGYEKAWQEVLKERKRRYGGTEDEAAKKSKSQEVDLNANGQLKLLTEMKKSVNENINLIKKRIDSVCDDSEGDSIHKLAEKNFSELDRLSKMADRSVKLYSGADSHKRDLNPGFDSENIQKPLKVEQPYLNYPKIKIPNISNIISLKSLPEPAAASSAPATSMDEPSSSAAGVADAAVEGPRDAGCQTDATWPGVDELHRSYRDLEAARKKEISELHRSNTLLRVECAHTTCAASRDSDRARAMLEELRHLAADKKKLRAGIKRLLTAVEFIRNQT